MYNKRNEDGSVNSYKDTKILGHGYYVPFGDINFSNEIERNIYNSVLILNYKGYKTVTSCHGHSIFSYIFKKGLYFNSGPRVTVSFDRSVKLKNTLLIKTHINDSIDDGSCNISIRVRYIFERMFTNKFLCAIIERYCEKLPYAYDIN
jgi:hypothetical protein